MGGDGSVWVLDDRRAVVEHFDRNGKVLGSFDPFSNSPSNDGANGLAIDKAGHLYVSQIEPNQIAVFDAQGTLLRTIGGAAEFASEQPTQIAVDANGRVFATQGPGRGELPGVTVFASDGHVLGGFGPVGTDGLGLSFPAGIALDGKGGLFVEDSDGESARLIHVQLPDALR